MAPPAPAFPVALLVVVVSIASVHAQAGSGSTATCSTDLFRLLPCLPYIEGSVAAPADTCCANLGSMVHDEPQCLCQALSNPSTAPVAVNMSRVMAMPRLCRLDLPSAAGACAGEPWRFCILGPDLFPSYSEVWTSIISLLRACKLFFVLTSQGLTTH